jgi:hypothetical protein
LKRSGFTRTITAAAAGAAFFAAVSEDTFAGTFNVSTTITASCSITNAGPANLAPTYTATTDTGTGSATTLNTFCTGTTPTVVLTDAAAGGSGGNVFVMTNGGGANLYYQISTNPTCNGTSADDAIDEGGTITLTGGTGLLNICAAVIAGVGVNVTAIAGTYQDTVTYTITP